MMMRMQDYKSKRFWLGLTLTLGMVVCLCTLGFWQLQRLHWKNGLIETFNNKDTYAAAPNFEAWNVDLSTPQPVLFFGFYMPEGTVIVPHGEQSIIYMPFKTTEGVIVMMRRGTVSTNDVPDMVLGEYSDHKTVSVVGVPMPRPRIIPYLHVPQSSGLIWPFLDWAGVQFRFQNNPLAPYVVTVLDEPEDGLKVDKTPPALRNEHMQYAIFWFTMAFVCLGLFGRFFFFAPRGK